MVTVVTRAANGVPLTHEQVDDNFIGLADAINNIGADVLAEAEEAKDAAILAASSAQSSSVSASSSANSASISMGEAATSAENASADAASAAASAADSASFVNALLAPDGSTKIGDGTGTVATRFLEGNGETSDQIGGIGAALATGTAVTFDAFGDSTMWGANPFNLANQVTTPPPVALQNFINLYFGGSSLTVVNRAISGTTATQMIAGTDGSGSTFAVKMASSTASAVYCNHGINDATGVNQTSPSDYKKALISFVRTCRKNSKSPILVTPFVNLTFGNFGSFARSERIKHFAKIMVAVAQEYSVTLVDNYYLLESLLDSGKYKPLDMLPDGVHASQDTYVKVGNNLADPFIGTIRALNGSNQFQIATVGASTGTGATTITTSASRAGAMVATASSGTRSLRLIVKIDRSGLDLYIAYPMYNDGSGGPMTIFVDGVSVGFLSMNVPGFTTSVGFIQDYEVKIVNDADVGLHIINITVASGGSAGVIGAFYVRTRETESSSKTLINPGSTSFTKKLLANAITLNSTTLGTTMLRDDLPSSRLLDDFEVEFNATFPLNSGFIINGFVYGTPSGAPIAQGAVMLAFNGAGQPYIYEATGPDAFSSSQLSTTDFTTTSKLWRVLVTKQVTGSLLGTISVFADGVQVGPTINLAKAYFGGFLGLWKLSTSSVLTINNLCQVVRQ